MGQLKALLYTEEEKKIAVWNKSKIHPLLDKTKYRIDYYGNLISFDRYGDVGAAHGWSMVHITPPEQGGSNFIYNLVPLNYRMEPKWRHDYREW